MSEEQAKKEREVNKKKCSSCGTENRGTARYCDNCGLSFPNATLE
ncbi:MAG TPA: zinc-ribbon domain-containing protein [Nitrososphaeraceae archaeon]|nr:zinc-ribbon domain-containing protein [Nitrososphaeraceae archaeon]